MIKVKVDYSGHKLFDDLEVEHRHDEDFENFEFKQFFVDNFDSFLEIVKYMLDFDVSAQLLNDFEFDFVDIDENIDADIVLDAVDIVLDVADIDTHTVDDAEQNFDELAVHDFRLFFFFVQHNDVYDELIEVIDNRRYLFFVHDDYKNCVMDY